jgi:EmrB/QacA subfamily drug resistance transporter
MPSTLSILVQVFTEPRERAQAIGIWAAVAGAAVAIGPILGGLLLEVTTWHAIFWVNPPLVVIALIATLRLVPESKDPSRPRLDPVGAALSTVGIIAFVITVIEVPDQGISTVTVGAAIAAIVFITAFVWWERRAPRPLLPMELFANRTFTVAIITVALVYGALMGVMFFLPQFLQLVQGDSPLQSGLAMLPAAGGLFLASLFSPRWAERFGTRRIVVSGLLLVVAGLALAAYLTADSAYVHVGTSLGLMGLGLGMVLPQATNAVLASVPRERAGMGSAVNDGVGELGGSLGVAILGSLLSLGYRNQIEAQISAAGDAIASIPASVVGAVRESLAAGSLAVAQLSADIATPIRQVAGNAFVSGMSTALMVAAAIVAAGALLAWRMFPVRVDKVEE